METNSPLMDNLRQLFAECDSDKNGILGRDEFCQLCSKIGLNMDAASETFERLDIDKNGKITFDEFAAGFMQTCKQQQTSSSSKANDQSTSATTTTTTTTTATTNNSDSKSVPSRFNQQQAQQQQQQQQQQQLQQKPPTSHQNATSRLAPSPRGRKSASPIGVLSLGSTGSSSSCSNLAWSSSATSTNNQMAPLRSASSHNQMLMGASGGGDTIASGPSSQLSGCGELSSKVDTGRGEPDVVVYNSDMIGGSQDYDQSACGSGQFGSLLSNSSYSQVKTMQDLLECVQKLQSENQQLSQIFFKEKRERAEHISQLGEEFDQQLKEVEERASRRAREEMENEKRRLSDMMQTERETLQHHYQTLEKISELVKSPSSGKLNEHGEVIDKVQSKLQDTFVENRQLKKSLLDTKTDVALIWKEMEKLKRQYEDKLSSAYEKHNETKSECDHIKQQLNLMKDSNRKLQDASDVITNYITDKVKPVITVATSDYEHADGNNFLQPGAIGLGVGGVSPSDSRRGSILSEYLNNNKHGDQSDSSDDGTNASSNGDLESIASSQGGGLRLIDNKLPRGSDDAMETKDKQALAIKTTDYRVGDLEQTEKSLDTKHLDGSHSQSYRNETKGTKKQQQQAGSKVSTTAATTSSGLKNFGRHFLLGARSSPDNKNEENASSTTTKKNPTTPTKSLAELKSVGVDNITDANIEPADGPSKSTFNIILVGDSFVGKSSFATRFMEGNFVQGLISNCSIDFKTKSYKVDGTNYTINLWDTAGQERFRSITASYFRKADGIILMYDVTDRRSYLNVRNWMSTISDTAAENVAVLLIGNKIDLRQKDNKHNCIPTQEGYRLAREYDIVFLETSVKTGTNLLPSMGRLIRLIAKNNTEEKEEDNDRIRLNDKSRTFNCMPKNC